MTDQHAFPQDWATGLQETVDWNDAGSFANHVDHPNLRDYVAEGMELDVNFSNNIVRVEEGKAYVHQEQTMTNDHRDSNGPDEKTLLGGTFVGQRGPSGDMVLSEGTTNYIWMNIPQHETDTVDFQVNTSGNPPPEPSLLIGRVNTATEQVFEENRAPATKSKRLVVAGGQFAAGWVDE